MKYIKPERIWLKTHAAIDERWVQARIAEDPAILGLGPLVLRDRERMQPRAGRLDLLLQNPDTDRRYEVEIQRGHTDESHIMRTIEYWDLDEAGLDVMEYNSRSGRYRIRLTGPDVDQHEALLAELLQLAYQDSGA